ncbi:MAG: restriction endonuclease subunit S, partial [Bacteroidales bacterium]|nr:restriction endonuclease subunit S [Bacteroidales bacterium]
KPFDIPESWCWCRLGDLGFFVRGNGIKRSDTVPKGYPCVRYGEMYTTYKIQFSETKSFTTKDIFDKCQKVHTDDILMALTGENKWDIALAAVYQGKEELALGGDLCKFSPIMSYPLFLVYFINSPIGIEYKRNTATGDIIVHISADKLANLLIPLPPLAEQKRIVAKLEEMLPLVEEYGKAQEELDTLNNEIPEKLKKAILQEAIQGKLVPQITEEGNAKDLLKKIETERKKSNPKYKPLPPVTDEEKPFEIPESWVWCRIGDLFFTTSGGTPLKGHPEFYVNGTIPWVKSGELKSKYLYNAETLITEEALKNSSAKYFPVNTVAVAMYGATIGKTSIFKKELTTNQAICGIFPNTHILPEYLYYFIQAKIQDYLSIAFGSGQPNISQEKIKETLFPLPPLSEQERIVVALEKMLPLCEKIGR